MSHFVRASKYRHVYVEAPKTEQSWTGIPVATTQGEQSYIKGNTKYMAVAVQGGGGPFAVLPYNKPGRYDRGGPLVSGHTASVLDFDFNPFHEQLVASCSEDCTVKVWGIPEEGFTETETEALIDLTGHGRKVTLLRFHPTANNVLASVSADMTVKLWDIEAGMNMNTLSAHEQLIQDIVWDYYGNTYATSCKDKTIRIVDARSPQVAQSVKMAHEGARSSKLTYLGTKEKLLSVGFTKQSQRQFKIWDPRSLKKAIKKIDIDQAAGVILPFYDDESSLLYLAGKGDGNIRYFECVDEQPYCFAISEYRSTTAAKGMAMIPKRGCHVMKCETARLLKLTSHSIEPLSFVVPRKSDAFQDDLFPPCPSGQPSHTADEWLSGSEKAPTKMDMRPRSAGTSVDPAQAARKIKAFAPLKSSKDLQKELEAAMTRISLLESVIKDHGLRVP
ncbi:unnamed protein product [Ascophyllum nodosum]